MSDNPYWWPGTRVLRNKLGITDRAALDRVERKLVLDRFGEGLPAGDFDLKHLQAIHRHLFQDVYEWAGQTRTINLSKSGDHFLEWSRIETGMASIHRRIIEAGYFKSTSSKDFAGRAAELVADLNFVHPFPEGNGRTQLSYLQKLASHAGHRLDLTRLRRESWIVASRASHPGRDDLEPMRACIEAGLEPRSAALD